MTSIVSLIDHAVLHPTQTLEDLRAACQMCREVGVASVCVKPSMVPAAAELLAGSDVLPSTVIGFPHGGASTAGKVAETDAACREGAKEVDMVVNIGAVLGGQWADVEADIRAVTEAAHGAGALLRLSS